MADVDSLDVHGVRYAEIHTGLKRDMKLGGIGFIALIDFTTVDTMRASLERVIAEKSGRELKIEAMCYYKKRRRGAVMIRTQRDVMLACCEYPLVTNTGKPSPDPYIRVGVILQGYNVPVVQPKDTLKANLKLRSNTGLTIGRAVSLTELKRAAGRGSGPVIRSVVGNARAINSSIPHIRADTATNTQTFILDEQPPRKKVCLDTDVEWALALPGKEDGTVEIRPIDTTPTEGMGHGTPGQNPSPPPELPVLIKEEPFDADEKTCANDNVKHSTTASSPISENESASLKDHSKHDENPNESSSMVDEDDDDDDDQIPLVICPRGKDSTSETEFKQMWDQIRKMESRLNYMDHNKTSRLSTSQSDPYEGSGSSEDISSKIASLEQRLYSMEKGKEESDAPLLYIGDRLSKVEKNVTKLISAVDKLHKSMAMVHRKHVKTNTTIDVISLSLNQLSESQVKTMETLEKISLLLEKNVA